MFNSCGFVIGINSTGFAPPDGLPFSTISSIRGLLTMEFDGITIAERRSGLYNQPNVQATLLNPDPETEVVLTTRRRE